MCMLLDFSDIRLDDTYDVISLNVTTKPVTSTARWLMTIQMVDFISG